MVPRLNIVLNDDVLLWQKEEKMIQVVILIIGFILLIKGADLFVDGASSTACNLKVSKMVIGLTIVLLE